MNDPSEIMYPSGMTTPVSVATLGMVGLFAAGDVNAIGIGLCLRDSDGQCNGEHPAYGIDLDDAVKLRDTITQLLAYDLSLKN